MVGDGPERVPYEKSAAELGLRDQVTFHGSQPKPVIAQMMREADLFVLPSRFDNLPCVVVEALASGLPVVSTTVGGIPELVDDERGRLVPPDDPSALADALEYMLEHLEAFDRRAIGEAARDRYSLEVVGEQLSGIYEASLRRRRSAPIAPTASLSQRTFTSRPAAFRRSTISSGSPPIRWYSTTSL